MWYKRLLALLLITLTVLPLAAPWDIRLRAQEPPPDAEDEAVARLMARMSGAEKVGQLFIVTFQGAEITENGPLAALIRDYHVGGVLLCPENGNILNEGDALTQVATLVGQIQQVAWSASKQVTGTQPSPFIPLFVAARHEGNGVPFTGIVNGTTPLPSEMALGATWNPDYAEAVGEIVGQELRALGINMLLGPSLDVLEVPRPDSTGDLGVRTFGGDPFWVGQMGQAYIRGVHSGADGALAVIAKHFPGLGASDRSLDEEVPTVQRTLEKLRQIDLAPFFAVAQAEEPLARPDGILVSHIRFRGLEGGRFVTTRPISVDSQALQRLLEQPELVAWREQGGVTVSDELGLRALRRFYDPGEESFNERHIAQDAFLSGNDLLLLSQFALSDDWEARVANMESTITFFQEKYDTDPSFQAAVDKAVARILRLKLALYGGGFSLSAAQPDVDALDEQVGTHAEVLSAIGRDAVTLLSPPSPDLVPAPPTSDDHIVIFTDGRRTSPCATCAAVPYIDPQALRNTIVRLYGPDATGQIDPDKIESFTFDRLEEALNRPPPPPTPTPAAGETVSPTQLSPVEAALQGADWIIFAMLNPAGDPPQSEVVKRFLSERADALRGSKMVVLAYDAPYYLDATEISKLSAYYVAYSRVEPFIEMSVRAMFSEFAPTGRPPVSVTGINYDLPTQTSPDPEQTIALYYTVIKPPEEGEPAPAPEPEGENEATPEPTTEPVQPKVGDTLELHTGVILDHNGHPVPDGTPVQFIFTYPREGLERSAEGVTRGGVAQTTVTLNRTGQLDISVQADPVPRTIALQITIPEGEPAIIWTPTPLPTPTPTATPTATPKPVPVIAESPTPTPGPAETVEEQPPAREEDGAALLASFGSLLLIGLVGYYAARLGRRTVSQAMRLALWCINGGLVLYLAYALRLPGFDLLYRREGPWEAAWVTLLGGLLPLLVVQVVNRWRR